MSKKLELRVLLLAAITIVGAASLYEIDFDHTNTQHAKENETVFLNLNGEPDVNYSPATWQLIDNEVIQVNIVNSLKHSEKIPIITDILFDSKTIESENHSEINDVMYYTGWKVALDKASENKTPLHIPHEFEILESVTDGDVTIILTNMMHEDGLSGTTKLLVDRNYNQIVSAEIIIYQVDEITDKEFAAIMRHEFGHALGLGHSNDKNDIMYYQVQTANEYISDCTIDNIVLLYGGKEDNRKEC